MKKTPRLTPILVAVSVVLSAVAPQAALAQFSQAIARPVAGSAMAPVTGAHGVNALPTLSVAAPLTGAPALNASLAAPSAPLAAPAASAIAAAAAPTVAPAPLAVTVAPVKAAAAALTVGTPGGAADSLASEAAAYSAEASAPAAAAASKGLVGRIADVVRGRASLSSLFDSSRAKTAGVFGHMGIQPQKPATLPNGGSFDELPTVPSPDRERTVLLQTYSLPGSRDVGGIFESSRKVLSADPKNLDAVVSAVKAMVDADPNRFGIPSSDLRLIHAKAFTGQGEQADTIYVYFNQIRDNLLVNGSALSFTIKVFDGKPVVVSQIGQIFPQMDVNTETVLTEDQITGQIAARTGLSVADVASTFEFYEEKIIYSRGSWRHVKLYTAEGVPYLVAVDVVTGLVFAYDNRTGLQESAPAAGAVAGKVGGKAVDKGPIMADSVVGEIALPFLEVKINGKSYVTDKDGRFTTGSGFEALPEGIELTATLSGPYVKIVDSTGKTLTVKVSVKAGDNQVVFNPGSTVDDENALAQVNAFDKVNRSLAFLRERKLTNDRMDRNQLTVRTNIDDECNAYYTPGRPSLNFFRSSKNCANTAYDTVAEHENGHYWDDMLGGIKNGGISEGWGDILSMFRLNNPIVGEHFLKVPRNGVDYVRHGENTYQYNEYDEVHDQGQAWGGFAWKLRKMLIEKLGAEQGAAVAEALVLPTMFAKAANIPDAIAQVLVNAMKNDGTMIYEAEIRAAAKIHGITLPASPSAGFVANLVERFTAPLRKLSAIKTTFSGASTSNKTGILAEGQAAPNVRATLEFTAGALLRGRVANEIRRYMDKTGLKYDLKEYKGWLESDFLLVIEGPEDQVREHAANIQRWMQSLSRDNMTLVAAAAPEKSVVPSWFIDTSKLSFAFVQKGKDGFLSAVLRNGRYELGVFLDANGAGQAIFTKYSPNPMGTPKKEELSLTTQDSRQTVADILRRIQAADPVSGDEKAALEAILATLSK